MGADIVLDVMAFLVAFILLFEMHVSGYARDKKRKLFNLFVIIAFVCTGLLLLFNCLVNYVDLTDLPVQLIIIATFLTMLFFQYAWLYMSTSYTTSAKLSKKRLIICAIPFLSGLVALIINYFTNFAFSYNSAADKLDINMIAVCCIFGAYPAINALILLPRMLKYKAKTLVFLVFPLSVLCVGVLFSWLPTKLNIGALYVLSILIVHLYRESEFRNRDTLTGIYNYAYLSKSVTKVARGKRNVTVLTVSLCNYKLFNQAYGFDIGDVMIKNICEYLTTVAEDKNVYRYSGDKFCFILRNAEKDKLENIANKILARFNEEWIHKEKGYVIPVNISIVQYPKYVGLASKIFSAIDFTLIDAKKLGSNQIIFYEENMISQVRRKYAVKDAIVKAIEKETFEVYIQPIYNIKSGAFDYGEALLRLTDNELGRIFPSEFIPAAEENGLIVDVTYVVVKKVCELIRDMKFKFNVSINFSSLHFAQDDMVRNVMKIINKSGIDPSRLIFEITESVMITSLDAVKKAMTNLAKHGIKFALDDYGQGYSNINCLAYLPFDTVKLDKALIDSVGKDEKLFSAVVSMIKKLGPKIVVEGVETKQQSELCANFKCDSIQGFFYSQPLCKDDLFKFLHEKKCMFLKQKPPIK